MQKGGLEIVFNLEWKHKLFNGEEKSNMVGIIDDPANELDYKTFKTYLLRNSGSSVGIDHLRVSYIKLGQQCYIDNSEEFEKALCIFRKSARMGKFIKLTLEYVNPIYVTKHCDVHTTVEHTVSENKSIPPEWFITYMMKFREDLLGQINTMINGNTYIFEPRTRDRGTSCKIEGISLAEYKKRMHPKERLQAYLRNKAAACVVSNNDYPTRLKNTVSPDITSDASEDSDIEIKNPSLPQRDIYIVKSFLTNDDDSLETAKPIPNKDPTINENPLVSVKEEKPKKETQSSSSFASNKIPPYKTDINPAVKNPICCIQDKKESDISSTSKESMNKLFDMDFVNCDQLKKFCGYSGRRCQFHWTIKNTGTMSWTPETEVWYSWGSVELKPMKEKIPCLPLKPGETCIICMDVTLPMYPGDYLCHFKFYHRNEVFGKWFGIEVKVDQPTRVKQQCVRSPVYDVINIRGAYELLLPNTWTTLKTSNNVQLTLKQAGTTDENIMDGEVTSSQSDPDDFTLSDGFITSRILTEQWLAKEDVSYHYQDTLNKTTDNEIISRTNKQDQNLSKSIHTELQTESHDETQPEESSDDSGSDTDNSDDEGSEYSSETTEDESVLNGDLKDCEPLEEKTNEGFSIFWDDDRSIISLPDSISSANSRPTDEFIHLSLNSPESEQAESKSTIGSTSDEENILEFEEFDFNQPKVESSVTLHDELHVTDQLEDAINDDSEDKQLLSNDHDNAVEFKTEEAAALDGIVVGGSAGNENESVASSNSLEKYKKKTPNDAVKVTHLTSTGQKNPQLANSTEAEQSDPSGKYHLPSSEQTEKSAESPKLRLSPKPAAHCGTSVANDEVADGDYVNLVTNILKGQMEKFKSRLSANILEAIDMIPDVRQNAEAGASLCPSRQKEVALQVLHDMGFQNETYNLILLARHNNDLKKVITELISYLE